MRVVHRIAEMRAARPGGGEIVGLVPTMGGLHAGHEALFRAARPECDLLVASLFVNAPQFTQAADLDAYPRDLSADAAVAEVAGVDVLFAPGADEMYPPGFATWVEPEGAATGLEESSRPGHFRAVATICLKLFNIVRPQIAWFGQKDAQQVAVLRQLVRDFDLDLEIREVETVRDPDGLALSSRNARLTAAERRRAAAIPRALATRNVATARDVLAQAGIEPEYLTVADLDGPTLAVAARIGETRLIDNVRLEGEPA